MVHEQRSVGAPDIIGGYPGTGGGTGQGISEAYGISDNGVAVGLAYDETNNPIAFRWTAREGMTRLTVNRPDTFSRANGISHDGSMIYGWNDQDTGFRSGVIWRDGVALDLVDVNRNPVGEALCVVGRRQRRRRRQLRLGDTADEAWRWTAAKPACSRRLHRRRACQTGQAACAHRCRPRTAKGRSPKVGTRSGEGFFPPQAYAFAVSDDGKVVVGGSGIFPVRHAFVWTEATGMAAAGRLCGSAWRHVPAGWDLASATPYRLTDKSSPAGASTATLSLRS